MLETALKYIKVECTCLLLSADELERSFGDANVEAKFLPFAEKEFFVDTARRFFALFGCRP